MHAAKVLHINVVDQLVEQLVENVLDRTWPAGTRLPTERDLADIYNTSRVSVRAALSRLVEWRVIEVRQGSGATVQPQVRWKSEMLPRLLKYLLAQQDWGRLVPIAFDAFELRRTLTVDIVRRACGRVSATDLDAARAVVEEAWAAREDLLSYASLDREFLPRIMEAADMVASLWFINDMGSAYLAVLSTVVGRFDVPESYRKHHFDTLDAIAANDPETATRCFERHLDEVDMHIIASLPEPLRVHLFGGR